MPSHHKYLEFYLPISLSCPSMPFLVIPTSPILTRSKLPLILILLSIRLSLSIPNSSLIILIHHFPFVIPLLALNQITHIAFNNFFQAKPFFVLLPPWVILSFNIVSLLVRIYNRLFPMGHAWRNNFKLRICSRLIPKVHHSVNWFLCSVASTYVDVDASVFIFERLFFKASFFY